LRSADHLPHCSEQSAKGRKLFSYEISVSMSRPHKHSSTHIGLLSLVDHFADPVSGKHTTPRERLLEVIEQGMLAEAMGFERFAVGEHHFSKYILPSAHLLLAAIATKTKRIRLFTAVTLLPLYDPVQLAEQIGVLDHLSDGRIEVSCARGVSELTGAIFGVAPEKVYEIMEDHLTQLLELLRSGRVRVNSTRNSPATVLEDDVLLVPHTVQQPHPRVWLGSGVHQDSCDLAVKLGVPLILPSLFRHPEDYLPCLERYRKGLAEKGLHEGVVTALPSYCWVAKTSQEARRHGNRAWINTWTMRNIIVVASDATLTLKALFPSGDRAYADLPPKSLTNLDASTNYSACHIIFC
jgi:alkanesulfonate monooxygenase SsuD/methylene tetrahydromethanopterin reductase-like flavin-dependent oxidoreductase (luciferase family)